MERPTHHLGGVSRGWPGDYPGQRSRHNACQRRPRLWWGLFETHASPTHLCGQVVKIPLENGQGPRIHVVPEAS